MSTSREQSSSDNFRLVSKISSSFLLSAIEDKSQDLYRYCETSYRCGIKSEWKNKYVLWDELFILRMILFITGSSLILPYCHEKSGQNVSAKHHTSLFKLYKFKFSLKTVEYYT